MILCERFLSTKTMINNTITFPTNLFTYDYGKLTTTGITSDSGESDVGDIFFKASVVVIGIVGTLANGLLCVLLAQLEWKKRGSINILIFNQMSLDFFSCFWLTVTYCVKLRNIYLAGMWGYLVCQFIDSELFIWTGLFGSVAGLVMITLERYAKLVHPVSHKKYFRKWMTLVGVIFSWMDGFLLNVPLSWFTTDVFQGQCLAGAYWPSVLVKRSCAAFLYIWILFLPLFVFVYCYGHILVVMRKRAKVSAGNNAASDAQQASSLRIQMNIIKTMITIISFYAISWIPESVYVLLANMVDDFNYQNNVWYSVVFMVFLNICVNPFIYAAQYNVLKSRIGQLVSRIQPATNETIQ